MLCARLALVGFLVGATLVLPGRAGAAPGVSLEVPAGQYVWGAAVAVSGTVSPTAAGEQIIVELDSGGGWKALATATTDASGAFAASIPARLGALRARVVSGNAKSAEQALNVLPRLALKRRRGTAFLGSRLTASVSPTGYEATAVVTVRRFGRVVGRRTVRIAHGRLRTVVPTPGVGSFAVRLELPAAHGLAARTMRFRVRAGARTLALGARGRDVRALHRRLATLRFRVPGISTRFTYGSRDAVIAFQKAYRLGRTGVVGRSTWALLGRAKGLRPRHRGPSPHIEIDKTRQILLVVRRGRVTAVLPVSTGATGNTPLGRWRIYLKTPGYNALGMYYSMYWFRGFAVHGYASVPPYPASHGCARIPIWAARSLYGHSHVGERVFVYT